MSVNKNIYVVYGYDLTDHYDELLTEEFCDTDEYEKWVCRQRRGQIQMFPDYVSGNHLYLGYIAAVFEDGYEDHAYMTDAYGLDSFAEMVNVEVETLPAAWREKISKADFNLMVFTEYS